MMYASGITHLAGILHTEYNEYDSIIKPMRLWLQSLGVRFQMARPSPTWNSVTMAGRDHRHRADAPRCQGERQLELTRDDLVFFTNGSLTQNATMGDTDTSHS